MAPFIIIYRTSLYLCLTFCLVLILPHQPSLLNICCNTLHISYFYVSFACIHVGVFVCDLGTFLKEPRCFFPVFLSHWSEQWNIRAALKTSMVESAWLNSYKKSTLMSAFCSFSWEHWTIFTVLKQFSHDPKCHHLQFLISENRCHISPCLVIYFVNPCHITGFHI